MGGALAPLACGAASPIAAESALRHDIYMRAASSIRDSNAKAPSSCEKFAPAAQHAVRRNNPLLTVALFAPTDLAHVWELQEEDARLLSV